MVGAIAGTCCTQAIIFLTINVLAGGSDSGCSCIGGKARLVMNSTNEHRQQKKAG